MENIVHYVIDELGYSAMPAVGDNDERLSDGVGIIGFLWNTELTQLVEHLRKKFPSFSFTRTLFTPTGNGAELRAIKHDIASLLRLNEARFEYGKELMFESGALYIEGILAI